jgi:hypothetical protein
MADDHVVRRGVVVELLVPLLHEPAHAVVGALRQTQPMTNGTSENENILHK